MGMQADPLTVKNENDRLLQTWLTACSGMVEKYIDRSIEKKAYIDYFTLSPAYKLYWVAANPIATLTDVYFDTTGLWEGDETEISDCFTNEDLSAVCLPRTWDLGVQAVKGLRTRYIGGLAAHAVNSAYVIASAGQTGTWAAGSYVCDMLSGAVGIVISYTPATRVLVVENYYGRFTIGNTLTQTTFENEDPVTASGVFESISIASLADVASDIVMACEMQVRYMWKHTTDFEVTGTAKDGLTVKQGHLSTPHLPLLAEVREVLNPYKRMLM